MAARAHDCGPEPSLRTPPSSSSSSPAYLVEQLTPDAVYVQLTESVFDTINKPMELHARKQLVKRHLDSNVFLDPTCPPSHVYRTPLFDDVRKIRVSSDMLFDIWRGL